MSRVNLTISLASLRRMTAEQLWDSLLSMTIQDSDQRILRDREEIRVDQRKQQAGLHARAYPGTNHRSR